MPNAAARPPRWERRKESRPAELLAAALEIFVERGFAATRLEEVARRAGVSKGTLYLYYESKEELFKAVVRETIVPLIQGLPPRRRDLGCAEHRAAAEVLRRMVAALRIDPARGDREADRRRGGELPGTRALLPRRGDPAERRVAGRDRRARRRERRIRADRRRGRDPRLDGAAGAEGDLGPLAGQGVPRRRADRSRTLHARAHRVRDGVPATARGAARMNRRILIASLALGAAILAGVPWLQSRLAVAQKSPGAPGAATQASGTGAGGAPGRTARRDRAAPEVIELSPTDLHDRDRDLDRADDPADRDAEGGRTGAGARKGGGRADRAERSRGHAGQARRPDRAHRPGGLPGPGARTRGDRAQRQGAARPGPPHAGEQSPAADQELHLAERVRQRPGRPRRRGRQSRRRPPRSWRRSARRSPTPRCARR